MPRGLGLFIYGTEGVGKTTFACQFPQPLSCFSLQETGFDDLLEVGLVPKECLGINIKDYADLYSQINKSKDKTIVIDSTSGFQQFISDHVTATDFENKPALFSAFSQGLRRNVPQHMIPFEALLNAKRAQGTNIVVLGHAEVDVIKNPMGADLVTYLPRVDVALAEIFTKWAQAVLFMNIEAPPDIVTEATKSGTILEGKVTKGAIRLMYTQKSLNHSAKNRLGLPPVIAMGENAQEGFKNFWSLVPQVYKG